jgi:hypothetical protein
MELRAGYTSGQHVQSIGAKLFPYLIGRDARLLLQFNVCFLIQTATTTVELELD